MVHDEHAAIFVYLHVTGLKELVLAEPLGPPGLDVCAARVEAVDAVLEEAVVAEVLKLLGGAG